MTDTVAFVQEWLMSGDHEPSQFDKDFAAAIDARCKVASDTGAGLREADIEARARAIAQQVVPYEAHSPHVSKSQMERRSAAKAAARLALATSTDATDGAWLRGAAQFLSDRLDELEWMDDDLEATLRDFMGHVDPAHDRLKSALAADTADGATGGGEVLCDFWLGDCRRCGKRADRDNQLEPCARPRGPFAPLVEPWTNDAHALASELRRVANGWGEGFRIVQLLRDAADQIDTTATTPGVDLLEQAARYRHVKRGTVYEVVGEAELQTVSGALVDGSALVVYRGKDGKLWAREEGEFHDGRFEPLKPAGDGGEA